MRGQITKLFQAAVSCKPRRDLHELAEPRVIGVLILNRCRREHDLRLDAPNNARQLDRMSRSNIQMRIPVEFNKLECRAEDLCRTFRFRRPLPGGAVGRSLTARTDDEMRPS